MNRKYRQRGYQENETVDRTSRSKPPRKERDGPKAPQMPGMQRVIKCVSCGTHLASDEPVEFSSQCSKCRSDLHTCRNCVHFNPSTRFECSQPIPARISPKHKRADCEFFEIREMVEKITTSKPGAVNPRDAFEDLFKS